MTISYAWEKTFLAVLGLARSKESLQKRLQYAGETMVPVEPHDVPIEIRDRLIYIQMRLAEKGARGDIGSIENTTRQMSDEEARELIEEFVGLMSDVAQHTGLPEAGGAEETRGAPEAPYGEVSDEALGRMLRRQIGRWIDAAPLEDLLEARGTIDDAIEERTSGG